MSAYQQRPASTTLQIISIVTFTFNLFLCIGAMLPVLPGFVSHTLGFDSLIAGVVIGAQYMATLLMRPLAGRICDNHGPKQAVIYGLYAMGAGGLLLALAAGLQMLPWLSLLALLISRLAIGFAQALMGIGTASWGIARVGMENTAQVISWNGVVCYGAIALGAPLGVFMANGLGLWSIGAATLVIAGASLLLARSKPAAAVIPGARMAFHAVLGRMLPYGMCVALGSIGFGTLATFITLYYASRGWADPAWCLTLFSLTFAGARVLFSGMVNRFGGFNVAIACLLVETLGLLLLWQAPSPAFALVGAALTGAGLSLVYPALGVEAVLRIPASSRSAALGAYALFFDLAMGVAGPLMGAIAARSGYPSIFLGAALMSALGFVICLLLQRRSRGPRNEIPLD
ncbi:MFS transporter [Pseudomonas jinjuensis]|uniref:Uncharacterized MFS-type transporter SAMN05216193_11939 n=1 Tax=Pseudomonas jinjuensis TaxID=198616 RepID=A0A1H0NZR9_9PSED|nr:MFS transporter [Pseudomonas jinjuensis]SDO97900.1 Predicted arabinose efflux permease, MFS family [Pseudomonas jinjuensis]